VEEEAEIASAPLRGVQRIGAYIDEIRASFLPPTPYTSPPTTTATPTPTPSIPPSSTGSSLFGQAGVRRAEYANAKVHLSQHHAHVFPRSFRVAFSDPNRTASLSLSLTLAIHTRECARAGVGGCVWRAVCVANIYVRGCARECVLAKPSQFRYSGDLRAN
jgi:hypothetical protein